MSKHRGKGHWTPPKCRSGKAAYRSQGPALHALQMIASGNEQGAASLDSMPKAAYRCRYCKSWHLTRQVDGPDVVVAVS